MTHSMGSVTPEAEKDDDPELKDSSVIDENPPGENGLMKSLNLSQTRHQCSLLSNSGKWLQIVKSGSISRATCFFHNKIPRHLVSLDEKYLRRCLDLINISAFKSASYRLSMDSLVIPKETATAHLVFDLPLVDDSGSLMISPAVAACKRITHLLDNHDPNSGTRRDDNSEKVLVSCDEKYIPDLQFQSYESRNMSKKAVSFSSVNSISSSSSSEQSSSFWSPPSSTVSQGTLQFTMKDNKMPYFVYSLDDQKEIYVASLSTSSVGSGFDPSSRDYSYLIHLKKDRGAEPQYLVGKVKVSTLFSDSLAVGKTVERQFVLYSRDANSELPCHIDNRRNRGLSKKVVDMLKNTVRASRFSRTSSISDFSSWEPFQELDHDLEPVNLLCNDELPPNLQTLAVVVREEVPEEEEKVGGWGMKFLKRPSLTRTENFECSTSIDVVIPSGIHGGTRMRNGGGPSSLIERWRSGGSCDCAGWDLGCSLTVFNGQGRKGEHESHCNLFELFEEGSRQGNQGLRIMSVRDGLYFVQFQTKISVLQSFSMALAYIHSQSQRLRPWSSGKCIEDFTK